MSGSGEPGAEAPAVERLRGVDASFLAMEDERNHLHVASLAVLDPASAPGGWSFEAVRALVASRLHLVPPLRRRLAGVPLGLDHPLWVDEGAVDLDFHLRRAALPPPGGERELAAFAADVMGRPLDRSRPLWEMHVVEGLADGRVATVNKTHHAVVDGVSGAELFARLLDLGPEPAPASPPPAGGEGGDPSARAPAPAAPSPAAPSDARMLVDALASLPQRFADAFALVGRTAGLAVELRRRNRTAAGSPPPSLFAAPRTPLNAAVTAHRRVAFTDLGLDELRRVKAALGGTVTDVVLAMAAGAVRAHLLDAGQLPAADLVALVPVTRRTDEDRGTLGNRASPLLVSLFTTVEDPVARLDGIAASSRRAKEQDELAGGDVLGEWAGVLTPAVAGPLARLVSGLLAREQVPPLCNLIVSNVPGPDVPLYLAGARLMALYPMAPVVDGAALNVTLMSYCGRMHVGLVADRDAVPDLEALVPRLHDALEELRAAAAGAGAQP